MGLTHRSVGTGAWDRGLSVCRSADGEYVVALAGNPNVGKSTVFNGLTGLHQHTGNWPGKTVSNAVGRFHTAAHGYALVDIPGTYSLLPHSAEEEVARDFVCFEDVDAVLVVCDATCLQRNLHLVLQILESGKRVVVCVNLLDEAARKGIRLELPRLSERLGVPIVGVVARKKGELARVGATLDTAMAQPIGGYTVQYPVAVESAIALIQPLLRPPHGLSPRFAALRLFEGDTAFSDTDDPVAFQ